MNGLNIYKMSVEIATDLPALSTILAASPVFVVDSEYEPNCKLKGACV